jgi:glycosyltransferase involved in cell wall biosynthesis
MGCDGPASEAWTRARAKVEVIGSIPGRIREYALISRTVRRERPDAVILWTSSRLGLKVAACQNSGVDKIIVHVGNPIQLSLMNAVAAESYALLPRGRRATLIPVSRHVEHSYQRAGGFRHFGSHVIYNGIAMNQFEYAPQLELPENIRVGMVARLDPIKDHATLLRAWPRVLQSKPGWHLDLAGDGPLRARLEELAADLKISDEVHFKGWVSNIPALMNTWSIVVHSTTAAEGLGNTVLEAMALGRPVVATGVAPILEMTDGGQVARISRVGDPEDLAHQIIDVEADWPRSRSQVESARARLEELFTPQRMVDEYLSCLGLEVQ